MTEDTNNVSKDQVVLLDLSLFVLDILSTNKISQDDPSNNIILEVPGALITMIWAAKADDDSGGDAGRKLLLDFIHAHLIGIKNDPIHKKSTNQSVIQLLNTIEQDINSLVELAYQRIIFEFAPLFQGGINTQGSETKSKGEKLVQIKRYEPALSISDYEQITLRNSYKSELDLNPHPLYDLYFLQIHHAQTVGVAASPVLKRKFLSLGRSTNNALKEWRNHFQEKSEERRYTQDNETLVKDIIGKYVNRNWEPLLLGFIFDITLSTAFPGGGILVNVATALASAALPVVMDVAEKKSGLPLTEMILGGIAVLGVVGLCIFVVIAANKYLSPLTNTTQKNNSSTPEIVNAIQDTPTFNLTPINETPPTLLVATQAFSTEVMASTNTPAAQKSTSNNPNYCMYVVQRNDTIQSIAAWFSVTEDDIKASDRLVNYGGVTFHQMIRVSASCCKNIENNGDTYLVQAGDNVFRLAINFSTSVDKIVSTNNLDDSRYIQTGQMLCIPHQ